MFYVIHLQTLLRKSLQVHQGDKVVRGKHTHKTGLKPLEHRFPFCSSKFGSNLGGPPSCSHPVWNMEPESDPRGLIDPGSLLGAHSLSAEVRVSRSDHSFGAEVLSVLQGIICVTHTQLAP